MGTLRAYRQAADSYIERRENPKTRKRVPLTANQHILHLLLTVFTLGLWAPIWFIRSLHGNPNPDREEIAAPPPAPAMRAGWPNVGPDGQREDARG